MPWYAKALAGLVVAYTVCPIDLIPDFIPVLGYLDDLIIVPAGIGLALRMAPPAVISRARQEADKASAEGKINTRAGIVIVLVVWMIILAAASLLIAKAFRK